MSTVKKIVIAIVALGATACSSSASAKDWTDEVIKAGFTDPVVMSDGHEATVLMATAGSCRLRFVGDKKPMRLFVTLPGAPLREETSFLSDPSLSLIKADKRFASCFSEEKQG